MTNQASPSERPPVTREFLARSQYNRDEIRETEALFGDCFYNLGGATETRRILGLLSPPPPRRILDVGCGLGGACQLMARTFDAEADGIDVCPDMVQLGQERLPADLIGRVRLECADVLAYEPRHPYDLVFSNCVFLHIHDKDALLQRLHRFLAPGGRLLFADFGLGVEGPEMREYVTTYRYDILGVARWQELLLRHGFEPIVCEDATARHRDYCVEALASPKVNAKWIEILKKRIARIDLGQHLWQVFSCRRT